MAKDDKKKFEFDTPEEAVVPAGVSATPEVTPPAETPPAPQLPVTFDRWFKTIGRPEHHAHGMRAYANTSGKKTIAQWAAIFAKY